MRVKQLKEISKNHVNELIEAMAMLLEVKVKTAKNEKRYADIVIQDASKKMEVKCWDYDDYVDLLSSLAANEVVLVRGVVGEYQGQLQLTIKHLQKADEAEIQMELLIPVSDWGSDTLQKGLQFFYDKIKNPQMKVLVDKMIFNEEFFNKYCTYPAARQVHHNFYNGLLQHTLEVLKYAITVAGTKKLTERQQDRLIVMGLLHDWAKIIEYTPLPAIGFTDAGTMLGHIFLGAHSALNIMNGIEGFDEEDKLIILNGLLSHHGKLEFGSPVLPKTVEAQILHHADKMSGDIESILSFMQQEESDDSFTGKLWNMGTDYYRRGIL